MPSLRTTRCSAAVSFKNSKSSTCERESHPTIAPGPARMRCIMIIHQHPPNTNTSIRTRKNGQSVLGSAHAWHVQQQVRMCGRIMCTMACAGGCGGCNCTTHRLKDSSLLVRKLLRTLYHLSCQSSNEAAYQGIQTSPQAQPHQDESTARALESCHQQPCIHTDVLRATLSMPREHVSITCRPPRGGGDNNHLSRVG